MKNPFHLQKCARLVVMGCICFLVCHGVLAPAAGELVAQIQTDRRVAEDSISVKEIMAVRRHALQEELVAHRKTGNLSGCWTAPPGSVRYFRNLL